MTSLTMASHVKHMHYNYCSASCLAINKYEYRTFLNHTLAENVALDYTVAQLVLL